MLTCTWAPTAFSGPQVVSGEYTPGETPTGQSLVDITSRFVRRVESLGISHLLIAQRWWGNAREIEGSSLDCLGMTAFFASQTSRINLITAIHPGFFQPAAIAKWGATIDNLTGGRWSINITSGWNLEEFDMYGVDALDHDGRYHRSAEFIEVLRGAWNHRTFSYKGRFYQVQNLIMQPRPTRKLQVYQGGQSDAAINLAAHHSDWMFINGNSPEGVRTIVQKVRHACLGSKRQVRFAMYAIPVCRRTDEEAWREINDKISRIDPILLEKRRERTAGAAGMWSTQDKINMLDSNEGYVPGLIGSPDTIMKKIETFRQAGIDMLHLNIGDAMFIETVLPEVIAL